jgi:dolichyl-phosphate-mannose-protein mannosyltransferase
LKHGDLCLTRGLCALMLAGHAGLLAWSAYCHSPVFNELGHLPAGLSHLQLGRFDLYTVNPPLVRTVAATSVCLEAPTTDWTRYVSPSTARPEVLVGLDFLQANRPHSFWLYTVGRWMCIPFSVLGGYICFRWANRLYGNTAGLMATALWCACPYVLGHACLMTPDAHAASVGLAAIYLFWRWLLAPCWNHALVAGLVLGLAELTKFTLLVFYPLCLVTWLLYRLSGPQRVPSPRWFRESAQFSALMMLSVLIINLGYCFEGSFQRLGVYRFHSRTLTGARLLADIPADGQNRFTDTWIGELPVPLPMNYLQGIDYQKSDFERGFRSYLHGKWKHGGWWYYYLYSLAVKAPLGTWMLISLAIGVSLLASGYSAPWRDEMALLLPAIAILMLVSSQTGFSAHSRYVLPALPFVFVWASKLGRCVALQQWKMMGIAVAALCWSIGSSLWHFPHNLSYFNELVGGPMNGHAHLLDSNIAWGQDLLYLRKWLDSHPEAAPIHLASFGWVDPRMAEIDSVLPPLGPDRLRHVADTTPDRFGPHPGWYAIDVNHLHSTNDAVVDEHGELSRPANENLNYRYFLHFHPVATAGYSIFIYHIPLNEANRVRRKLGLSDLSEHSE